MADQPTQPAKTKVFVSYSRKDKEFIQKLNAALDASGIDAWVDWEGIPLASDWRSEIRQAIIKADAFVFVISPDSSASEECGKEVDIALDYNKKLVPVLYRMPEKDGPQPHQKIRDVNWTYMRADDDFDATLPKLLDAIKTDLTWVKQNSRLLELALDWESNKKSSSALLRGRELEGAERWRTAAASANDRKVNHIQNEFIDASRKAVNQGQQRFIFGVVTALAVAVGLAILAGWLGYLAIKSEKVAQQNAQTAVAAQATAQFNEQLAKTEEARANISYATAVAAEATAQANEQLAIQNEQLAIRNENSARAQRSAAQAQIYQRRPGELDLSTLFAIDSIQRLPSFQAEEILRQNIGRLPRPIGEARHEGHIANISFSPDGSRFVSASWDGYACLWLANNITQQRCLSHDFWVLDGFFIDNQRVVTAANDTVTVWNADTGESVFHYTAPARVTAIAVSPDDIWLAVGTINNNNNDELFIVNLVTGKLTWNFEQTGDVIKLEFSANNKRLAIGTTAGKLNIWPVQTNDLYPGPSHRNPIVDLAFSPDGSLLVSGGLDSLARTVDAANGGTRFTKTMDDWLEDIVFSPDGSFFAVASDDFRVYVWDAQTNRERLRLQHQNYVAKVAVSSDNQWIASSSYDFTARVWNAVTGDLMREIPLEDFGSALAFSPDGKSLVVGEHGGRVSMWALESLAVREGYLEFPELVQKAVFSADGQWLVANSDDEKVWLLSADAWQTSTQGTRNSKQLIDANNLVFDLAFSPDSQWVATNTADNNVYLYSLLKNRTAVLDSVANERSALAFSPDSTQLAVSLGADVSIWDVESAALSNQFTVSDEDYDISSISFSVDGKWLAVVQPGKTLVWDIAANKAVVELPQAGNVIAAAFNNKGDWLATASDDGRTILWSLQNGTFKERHIFKQDRRALMLQFSRDDKLLAIAGEEGATYIVQVSTGEEYARIQNSVAVTSVSFSQDGKYLATVSRKVVQFWNLSELEIVPKNLIIEIACSRLLANLNEAEWAGIFPDDPYHLICPDLPTSGQ